MLNLHLLAALTANDCPTETIQSVNDCLVKTEPNDKFVILKARPGMENVASINGVMNGG